MDKLKNKVVLITGGTTGIGAATAKLFQAEEAKVIVTGSNPETISQARESLTNIEVLASNAGDTTEIKKLVGELRSRFGRIDVLFLNAGVAQPTPFENVDEQFYDFQFAINARGVFFLIKEAVDLMPEGGSIILNASVAHAQGLPGFSVYAATKAAVRSFARSFAAELAPRKIRVNVISPGPIETPIFGKMGMPVATRNELLKELVNKVPLKRLGKPEEVAAAALFLASDDSSFTTGADILVDGGLLEVGAS
jgi:NAD(P)-dependent dehydrogenase (short-subunit alcohol dehydrogenase family)